MIDFFGYLIEVVLVDILDGDVFYPLNIAINQIADFFSGEQVILSVDQHKPDLSCMLHVFDNLGLQT